MPQSNDPPNADLSSRGVPQRTRLWRNRGEDDGSLHALGNGLFCAYAQGPNIVQAFGPPYSAPSFANVRIDEAVETEVRSRRETGTAVWRHDILQNGQTIAEMTDLVDADLPALARRMVVRQPLRLRIEIEPCATPIPSASGILATIPSGVFVYGAYPLTNPLWHEVLVTGSATLTPTDNAHVWHLHCEPGESRLLLVGGHTYPECIGVSEEVAATTWDDMLERTRADWRAFTAQRREDLQPGAQGGTFPPEALETIDNVAVLIRAQQGRDGGVLAGCFYHLAYVRDQYGVSRALLELGHLDEARRILERYWEIWMRLGRLHNAHGISGDDCGGGAGISHVHENDEVEITGYLLVQAFDYLAASGEDAFIAEILPMLEWALHVQMRHLVGDMLPFNGDETYVAGGVLPRTTLNDGSAEATMLFLTGGRRLIEWVETRDAAAGERLTEERKVLGRVSERFHGNFWQDGRLLTNNPARRTDYPEQAALAMPRFRHGVCEAGMHFGWTEVNAHGRYCCPQCLQDGGPTAAELEKHYVQSVSMVPLFINSSVLTPEEIRGLIDSLVAQYERTGILPSSPDGARTVGLDFGLLLYSMVEMDHAAARSVFQSMLAALDPAGAWVEYYDNGRPAGCRCRPWESGVNLVAMIRFIEKEAESA